MNTELLNGELSVSYPESFHVMDAAELKAAFADDNPNRWGIWDTGNHMIVAVLWNTSNKLISGLASTKSLAERAEKLTAKAYKHAGYRYGEPVATTVCGEKAVGFTYAYTQFDVEQSGEIVVFKHGATCYTVYAFERTELLAQTHGLFEDMLASMAIA